MENPGKFDYVQLQQLDYVKNSQIDIKYNSAYSTVEIADITGASIFMQYEEASDFIEEINFQSSEVFFNENEHDVALFLCYNYADMLGEM